MIPFPSWGQIPPKCAHLPCPYFIYDYTGAVVLTIAGATVYYCCRSCFLDALEDYLQSQRGRERLEKLDLLSSLGYQPPPEP